MWLVGGISEVVGVLMGKVVDRKWPCKGRGGKGKVVDVVAKGCVINNPYLPHVYNMQREYQVWLTRSTLYIVLIISVVF